MERTPNKSQHTQLTLEKKILQPLLPGFELASFRSRDRRSNQQAIPAPHASLCPAGWPFVLLLYLLLFLCALLSVVLGIAPPPPPPPLHFCFCPLPDVAGLDSLVSELHARTLYTTTFHGVGDFLDTSFPRRHDAPEAGLVVLGPYRFVQQVFVQVRMANNGPLATL